MVEGHRRLVIQVPDELFNEIAQTVGLENVRRFLLDASRHCLEHECKILVKNNIKKIEFQNKMK